MGAATRRARPAGAVRRTSARTGRARRRSRRAGARLAEPAQPHRHRGQPAPAEDAGEQRPVPGRLPRHHRPAVDELMALVHLRGREEGAEVARGGDEERDDAFDVELVKVEVQPQRPDAERRLVEPRASEVRPRRLPEPGVVLAIVGEDEPRERLGFEHDVERGALVRHGHEQRQLARQPDRFVGRGERHRQDRAPTRRLARWPRPGAARPSRSRCRSSNVREPPGDGRLSMKLGGWDSNPQPFG